MKHWQQSISTIITSIENAPTSVSLGYIAFLSLIIARLGIENGLSGFETHSFYFFLYEFTHTFFFFGFSFLVFWPLLSKFARVNLTQAGNILLTGFTIILTPPLIDAWVSGGRGYWSFYKFDSLLGLWHRYLTFFGDKPYIGITYGVRVEVALTILLFGWYTYNKTRHIRRALLAAITAYTLLFILGTFPSWISFIILGFQQSLFSIDEISIAQLFLSPPVLFAQSHFDFLSALNIKMSLFYSLFNAFLLLIIAITFRSRIFMHCFRNIRLPQVIYHIGLLFTGSVLALLFVKPSLPLTIFNALGMLNICVAVTGAWITSVVMNDIFDQKTDNISNRHRPLPQKIISPQDYAFIGIFFFTISILFSAIVHIKIAALLILYQALAWIYSAPPLRLKRFPFIATFIAATASLLIIFSGFIILTKDGNLTLFPSSFIALFLFALTFSLPLKDFKDMQGDAADGVITLPLLFGEYTAKIFIGSSLFLSYILSVVVLREPRLIWWAIACGSISFWIILLSQKTHSTLSHRTIHGYILIVLSLYLGIILLSIF